MISMTQLRNEMETASLSDEGRAKLDKLLAKAPFDGFEVLLENSSTAKFYENLLKEKSDAPLFAILSRQDMGALDGLRQLDTGIVLYSNGTTASVVPMFLVYNDALNRTSSLTAAVAEKHGKQSGCAGESRNHDQV